MSVERLVLGTVALGIPYGLPGGDGMVGSRDATTASRVIRLAFDAGITTFDTAPSYGEAESRLGRALGKRGNLWTKLSDLKADATLTESSITSLTASLGKLRRNRISLLQWHNWTACLADNPHFRDCWAFLRADDRIEALGASTYGAADALAAVRSGYFRCVQVEWNLLNQKALNEIEGAAKAAGVAIAVRSVFLQGVLTAKGDSLPAHLRGLGEPRARAAAMAASFGLPLNAFALRAALDHPARPVVLIGPDREDQLAEIVEHAHLPPLDPRAYPALAELDIGPLPLTDPRTWNVRST